MTGPEAPPVPPPATRRKRRWGRKVRNAIAGLIGPLVVRVWVGSLRLRVLGATRLLNGAPCPADPGIYAFWHQHIFVLAGTHRGSNFRVLISQHGDGEMIARIIERQGMRTIRGSSTRGGARAALEAIRGRAATDDFGITPDGPRGPRHVFQEGAVYLASKTGLPIYPTSVAVRRGVSLPTWDAFLLPLPFTRALVRFGDPVRIPPDISRDGLEAARKDLESRLREQCEAGRRDFDALWRRGVKVRNVGRTHPGA
jgi:lysophospholipid acyltransferase (LPLAT)-like uncharacterized protein